MRALPVLARALIVVAFVLPSCGSDSSGTRSERVRAMIKRSMGKHVGSRILVNHTMPQRPDGFWDEQRNTFRNTRRDAAAVPHTVDESHAYRCVLCDYTQSGDVFDHVEQPVSIGTTKQLLIDGYIVDKALNLRRRFSQAEQVGYVGYGNKELYHWEKFTRPCGCASYSTTLPHPHSPGVLISWYRCNCERICVMVSNDEGRTWHGHMETAIRWNGDEQPNNIVIQTHRNVYFSVTWSEKDERFLMAHSCGIASLCLAFSRDGIYWMPWDYAEYYDNVYPDTSVQFMWHPTLQTYLLVARGNYGFTTADGNNHHWREIRGVAALSNPDALTVRSKTNWHQFLKLYLDLEHKYEYVARQIYAFNLWLYEGMCIAILYIYTFPLDLSEGNPDPTRLFHRDVIDTYLAFSRDCANWDFSMVYDQTPFIVRKPGQAMMMAHSAFLSFADRHELYVWSHNERHTFVNDFWETRSNHFNYTREHIRTRLRRDGFAYLTPSDMALPAMVTTKRLSLCCAKLLINIDAQRGFALVEVLDSRTDEPIQGFGLDDSPVITADMLDLPMIWGRSQEASYDLGRLLTASGGPTDIRLRFHLYDDARLYAFQFAQ